ncbi:MAG TPA: histidine kinase [Mycobacteriales bacterium]
MTAPAWASRDDGWFAGIAAALTVAVGVLSALTGSRDAGGACRLLSVAGCAVALAAYLLETRGRRLPVPLLVVWTYAPPVVLGLLECSEGTMFLLVIAVSYVVLVEDDRRVRIAAGLLAVLTPAIVTLAVRPDWGWPYWTAGILFGWLSAEQMRRFRALVAELTRTRQRLAAQAVHLERRRIAAELHDLVGHSLGVLLLHVTGARRRLATDPDGAADALRQAEGIGRAGLAEIRRGVAALRDEDGAALEPTPSATDLPALVARTGEHVTLSVSGPLAAVGALPGLAVYRVVQESLANAARHAPGGPVEVHVDVRPGEVDVTVRDAGPAAGAPASPDPAGVGLIGMRERVTALGGTLTAGPAGTARAAGPAGTAGTARAAGPAGTAGPGWVVRARIPLTGARVRP